jgi:predicted amidophosphoribosyltransferase
MRGQWGSLIGVALFGVGLVLFVLGFDRHTTEALPFGIVGLVAGLAISVPSVRALRGAIREVDAHGPQGRGEPIALTDSGAPTSVACTSCGARARLRLDRPAHADCEHCGAHLALDAELTRRLIDAANAVKAQGQAERQLSEVIRSLPEREAALHGRLLRLTVGLASLALAAGAYGFARRYTDDGWHRFVLFALTAAPAAVLLGRWCLRALPRAVMGVVGHWAALQLPGQAGLSCRACGAPLPSSAQAVLRCEFCGTDSLASPAVVARVAQSAQLTRSAVLGAQRQSRSADELAAFTIRAFPLAVLLSWFALGAAAGGAAGSLIRDLPVGVPSELHFAVVDGAIVGVKGTTLYLDANETREVNAAPALLRAEELEGLELLDGGKITKVWSRLSAPSRPCATTSSGSTLYLPGPYGGGERIAVLQ